MSKNAFCIMLVAAGCRVEWGPPTSSQDCGSGEATGEVWIYTSMYPEVVASLEGLVQAELPGLQTKWFQSGSEKVAQRYEAELSAAGSKACLLMTSDPFWYDDLASRDLLAPHLVPNVLHLPRGYVHPDGLWTTARISLMVLAAHEDASPVPSTFADLTGEAYDGRFTMGDPLSSGSNFTALSVLQDDLGWDYWTALKGRGLVSAGGNSSVLGRLESGERDVGMVLLENLLAAAESGSPARPIFPEDGAIAVPGPIALTAGCPNPAGARALYDLLMGPQAQQLMVQGRMYSPLPELPPPDGAPALSDIAVRPWTAELRARIMADRSDIKSRFAALQASP